MFVVASFAGGIWNGLFLLPCCPSGMSEFVAQHYNAQTPVAFLTGLVAGRVVQKQPHCPNNTNNPSFWNIFCDGCFRGGDG